MLFVESKPQKVIAEWAECSQNMKHINEELTGKDKYSRKRFTRKEMTATSRALSSKANSRSWVCFTRSGLRLVSVHQEPLCIGMSRKWFTNVIFLVSSHFWTRGNVRSALPGLRRRTELLRGPKSSFQIKIIFVFGNQGRNV